MNGDIVAVKILLPEVGYPKRTELRPAGHNRNDDRIYDYFGIRTFNLINTMENKNAGDGIEPAASSLGNRMSIESKEQWRLWRSFLNHRTRHFSGFRRASSGIKTVPSRRKNCSVLWFVRICFYTQC